MIIPNYKLLKEVDELMKEEDKLFPDPALKCWNCGESEWIGQHCAHCGEHWKGD